MIGGSLTMIGLLGETAGKVWNYLMEHPSATPRQLSKALNLKESVIYMALGWLAREGKLAFDADGKAVKLAVFAEAARN
jgi:hypothetical protein